MCATLNSQAVIDRPIFGVSSFNANSIPRVGITASFRFRTFSISLCIDRGPANRPRSPSPLPSLIRYARNYFSHFQRLGSFDYNFNFIRLELFFPSISLFRTIILIFCPAFCAGCCTPFDCCLRQNVQFRHFFFAALLRPISLRRSGAVHLGWRRPWR